jgi:radical SAM superfamily enzyme YgiQ (UPF0313 family)
MRAHLILPPFPFLRKEKILLLNLAYLAAAAPSDVQLAIFDANLNELSPKSFAAAVAGLETDLLLFTAHTYQIGYAARATRAAKAAHPRVKAIIGGPHVSVLPEETLRRYPEFDGAAIGEGEPTLREIFAALGGGESLASVAGMAYREDKQVHRTPGRDLLDDLDSLPFPAWHYFEVNRYSGFYPLRGTSIPVITARGCPYRCRFCARAHGNRMRYRSVESVLAEIERGLAAGHRTFAFVDETFTVDRTRALRICELLAGLRPERAVEWVAQTRVDRMDEEVLAAMARAGCLAVNVGIESGDQEVLSSLGKDITVEQIRRAIEICRRTGIKALANVILGGPRETPATLRTTRRLVLSLRPDRLAVNQLVAFPGAEFYDMAQRGDAGLRLLHEDWSYSHPQMRSNLHFPGVSQRRISWAQFYLYCRFYIWNAHLGALRGNVRPRFVWQYLRGLFRTIFVGRRPTT